MRTTILCITLVCASSSLFAMQKGTPTNSSGFVIDAVRIDGEVVMTGRVTDRHWKAAPRVEISYEIQPGNNTPAPQRTTAMALYNSQYLYIAFICHDTDPSKIRAHITDRDNIFQDDFVGVLLDTYDDHQRAYEFFVNPYGIQADLMRNGNNEDASWDAVWYSKAAINDTGYTVEMAIPFKSLRFPSSDVQSWGLELFRNLPRESRVQISWVRLNLNDPCLMCQLGTIKGLKGLQSIGSIELLPYAMGVQSGNVENSDVPDSHFSNGAVEGRIGGGVKYSPNPTLSLEGVVNPDFSQIESDAAQISVNTTFALFYPEKRPFFMDGNDILSTLIQGYYSRMINDPMGAAKVIQKSGALSVAYLAAEDRNSPFIVAGEEGSIADNNGDNTFATPFRSFSNILRARYNFGMQSFIGALGTARNFSNAHNYVGGMDWNFFFGGNYTIDGQFLVSNTRELNDTSLVSDPTYFGNTKFTKAFDGQEYDGTGLQVDFKRDARHYSFRLTYKDFSPTFQAENGYVFSNDLRTADMDHSLFFYPNTALVESWGVDLESGLHYDYQGVRKERWVVPTLILNLKSQTQLEVNYLLVNDELFHSVNFTGVNRWQFNLNTNPTSSVSFGLSMSVGRFIYREDEPALGAGHNISAEMVVKPTEKLTVTVDYARSRLTNVVSKGLFFDGYISRVEGIYQFSNRVFVRLISQYDEFNKQFEIDPLFSYKMNPFTIFYAGSTHSMQDYGKPYGLLETERQFFVKLQYLWRD